MVDIVNKVTIAATALLLVATALLLVGCTPSERPPLKYPGPLECVWWENGSLTTGHCS